MHCLTFVNDRPGSFPKVRSLRKCVVYRRRHRSSVKGKSVILVGDVCETSPNRNHLLLIHPSIPSESLIPDLLPSTPFDSLRLPSTSLRERFFAQGAFLRSGSVLVMVERSDGVKASQPTVMSFILTFG